MSWTGVDQAKGATISRDLYRKDLTALLEKGAAAGRDDLRSGALYCFNMLLYVDSEFMRKYQVYLNGGGDKDKVGKQGIIPDLANRGAIRCVFDGRYKYARLFSPREPNQPRTPEGIFELDDVESFDLDWVRIL